MTLSINVIAMIIAFVAVVAAVNWMLTAALNSVGVPVTQPLETFLGWINAPFAWLLGIQWSDCQIAGGILGKRIVLNEFVAYLDVIAAKDKLSAHSITLITYALCGFANFASIAIQIGGIGSLAPERRADLARLGWRSMIGGLLACYLTAAIVGLVLPN